MIQEFVNRWFEKKYIVEEYFKQNHPNDYGDIVHEVIKVLTDDGYDSIDPERIHTIDDGDYQGTLLYVIGAKNYQPDDYWYAKVGYGSCSGCDTLQSIRDYDDGKPTEEQVADYMTLALHIVQGLKEMP